MSRQSEYRAARPEPFNRVCGLLVGGTWLVHWHSSGRLSLSDQVSSAARYTGAQALLLAGKLRRQGVGDVAVRRAS